MHAAWILVVGLGAAILAVTAPRKYKGLLFGAGAGFVIGYFLF